MTKKDKTYAQKVHRIRQVMQAEKTRHLGKTNIYDLLEHTPYGMRKTDHFKAYDALKEAEKVVAQNKNSNMRPETQKKLATDLYAAARDQTPRGQKEFIKKLSKKRQILYKKRGKKATVQDIADRLYKNVKITKGGYREFYLIID